MELYHGSGLIAQCSIFYAFVRCGLYPMASDHVARQRQAGSTSSWSAAQLVNGEPLMKRRGLTSTHFYHNQGILLCIVKRHIILIARPFFRRERFADTNPTPPCRCATS